MKMVKRIILLLITVSMTIILTSCINLDSTTIIAVREGFNRKIAQNNAIIRELEMMNVIDNDQAELIRKSMDKCADDFMNGLSDISKMTHFFAYVSAWREVTAYEYATYHHYTCTVDPETGAVTHWSDKIPNDWDKEYLTSFARVNENEIIKALKRHLDDLLVTDDKVAMNDELSKKTKPFELFSDIYETYINKKLSYKVCILNKDAKDVNGNPVSLETIVDKAKNLDTSDSNAVIEFKNKYFIVTDAPVIDITNPDYQIIQNTIGSDNKTISEGREKLIAGCSNHGGNTLPDLTEDPDEAGYDLNIRQNGKLTLKIRLREFNQKAFDNIKKALGSGGDRYIFMGDGTGGFALLMEYPVGYISNIEIDDDNNYKLNIEKSRITVNIRTGKINKTNSKGDILYTNNEDSYYTLSNGADTSSFGFYGETGIDGDGTENPWNLEFGPEGKEVKVSLSRIILKDYLEATYNPGVMNNENLVLFGRKIRIDLDRVKQGTQLTNNRTPIGWYCEQGGKKPEDYADARWVYLDQLCDFDALNRGNLGNQNAKPYIKRLPNTITTGYSPTSDVNEMLEAEGEKPSTIEKLDEVIVSQIYPTCIFPGRNGLVNSTLPSKDTHGIGNIDIEALDDPYNSKKLQIMYCMCVGTPLVESGLLSWQVSNSTVEGTTWWKGWLEKHQYNYGNQLNLDVMNEYLKDNYSFELAEMDIIILNMDTLNRINEEFAQKDEINLLKICRTICMILGWALILYSLLLMMCWAFDVNVGLGLSLLEKASFNQMIAVSSRIEIPQTSDSGQRYVQFSDIVSKCTFIAIIGCIFVVMDVRFVAMTIVKLFGGIALILERLRG